MREDFRDQAIPLEKEKEEEKTTRIEVNWVRLGESCREQEQHSGRD
jgi:hypothetical protein